MPIYEYACSDCQHQFEQMQKMSESPLTQCPNCKRATLQKIISATGFRLSGKGWYETDYKTTQKKNLSESTDSQTPSTPHEAS